MISICWSLPFFAHIQDIKPIFPFWSSLSDRTLNSIHRVWWKRWLGLWAVGLILLLLLTERELSHSLLLHFYLLCSAYVSIPGRKPKWRRRYNTSLHKTECCDKYVWKVSSLIHQNSNSLCVGVSLRQGTINEGRLMSHRNLNPIECVPLNHVSILSPAPSHHIARHTLESSFLLHTSLSSPDTSS